MSRSMRERQGAFEAAAAEGPGVRLAQLISNITNPLFVALPIFLLVALHSAPDLLHGLLWWGVTVAGMSAAPLLFIRRGVRRGAYSDQHLSIREQRFIPLLFGLGCSGIVFVLLLLLHVSRFLIATVVAVIITGLIALLVTRYWKISLHLVGVAGAVTVLGLVFGPGYFLLSPLVVLVGWARWRLRAHTVLQACAGTVLAVGVALATFWLLTYL